jgi:membrane protease YdiL (CAAX protease family)
MNTQEAGYKANSFDPRNLTFFFLLAFGISWVAAALIFVFGLNLSTSGSGPINPFVVLFGVIGTIGPSLAAFIVTGFSEGKAGVKALWKRFWNRNMSLMWLFAILFFGDAFRLIANLIARAVDGQTYPIIDSSTPLWISIPALVAAFIYSGVAEEFGWRGYALPRFQARWNALTSSIVLGIIWLSWHIPFFFTPGVPLYQRNFWQWAPWVLMLSVIYTWFFNNTRGSVLAAVLFHATMNSSLVILPTMDSLWYYYGLLLIAVIFIVIIFGPKNLVRQSVKDESPHASETIAFTPNSP